MARHWSDGCRGVRFRVGVGVIADGYNEPAQRSSTRNVPSLAIFRAKPDAAKEDTQGKSQKRTLITKMIGAGFLFLLVFAQAYAQTDPPLGSGQVRFLL